MKNTLISLLFCGFASILFSQTKKPITHNDYDLWKSISDVKVSKTGKLIVYEVKTTTDRGDGYLRIYDAKTAKEKTFKNGYKAQISPDEKFVYFQRKPNYETQRSERKKEVKTPKKEKDAFFVYDVSKQMLTDSIFGIKNYGIPKKYGNWVAVQKVKDEKSKEKSKDTTAVKKKKWNEEGDYLLVYNVANRVSDTVFLIDQYVFAEENPVVYYLKKSEKKTKNGGVFRVDLNNLATQLIDTGKVAYKHLATDKTGKTAAYLSIKDSVKNDSLRYAFQYWNGTEAKVIVDEDYKLLPQDWQISKYQSPEFSKNDKRIYFSAKPIENRTIDTTLIKDEKAEVDVWNWQDKMIQPEQKVKKKQLTELAYQFYYDLESGNIVQLNDPEMEDLIFDKNKEQAYILGSTSHPYDVERSWDWPWKNDFYSVETSTGKRTKILEGISDRPDLQPNSHFAIYYNQTTKNWFSVDLKSGKTLNLTASVEVPLYDEDDDHPALPPAHGFGGWLADGSALVYDKYDIWKLDVTGNNPPENITKTGRSAKITFRTLRLDPENRELATETNHNLILTSFNHATKGDGVYFLNLKSGKLTPQKAYDNFSINGIEKAEEADVFVFRKQNFSTYPDLYLTDKNFKTEKKISGINPQQKDFAWGTVELVSWKAFDGTPLEGLLYKPENFDSNKKYPMITYFYEKRSETLHNYYSPQPSASTVNMAYLVSNGYLVFVPDIVYKDGYPGESAYNCILSGVEAMEQKGFVDSQKMALQGQSWGGYQTAYLITRTNKFAAAMAGAPVANMTSAYGGIRWESGLNRAFQYERSQTRIGKNLWEGFDLYIENSPLFAAPKVETPLLMMHNDADGAVPYYQGIEFFMGLRRLNKPVWLLVYNNEAHNLRKMKNKQDLSIRMMQFFDYYLKNAPAPEWMTDGVPITNKGLDYGYELDDK
jgi:dipeptidyl aminopeptidase/acylaminoacyl peptidase